ncbi:MAG: hypothetical protein HUJ96_00390 [Marinilabiliaceae bacterium]|nr:hypothetical protein [Marinilabiliaceae bacterium]
MRKETIIDIILSTTEEIAKLAKTLDDSEKIPQPFLDLLKCKYEALGSEVRLLDFWADGETTSFVQSKEESDDEDNKSLEVEEEPDIEVELVEIEQPEIEQVVIDASKNTPFGPAKAYGDEVGVEEESINEIKVFAKPREERGANHLDDGSSNRKVVATAPVSASDTINYGTPVSNVRRALGLNDQFLYRRELFGGDVNLMNQTLDEINNASSYDEAHSLLLRFGWDESDAIVDAFMRAVHRRFL